MRKLAIVLFFVLLAPLWADVTLLGETWTDSTGKYSVEAEFFSFTDETLVLRREDGDLIKIPLKKLSAESVKQAKVHAGAENVDLAAGDKNAPPAIQDAKELEAVAKMQRSAADALAIYEKFLTRQGLEGSERQKVEQRIERWRERAQKDLWRWGSQWIPFDEIRGNIEDEERLIKEAHRFMEINNDKLARERFEQASSKNPEGVRGDFYLGVLHALIARDAESAYERFTRCVNRLKKNPGELTGVRRANYIAALNNRAICLARMSEHSRAIRDWVRALELAPLTPELVQNLGYYAKLASLVAGWTVSPQTAEQIAEQYARVSVANQSDTFEENVGWLFIPYVDAPVMPSFVKLRPIEDDDIDKDDVSFASLATDNELRIVGWATGLAVDAQHLLTARESVQDAYRLWSAVAGEVRRNSPGRVVATSPNRELALIRFHELNANIMPLSHDKTTRADDCWAVSFPEPGILQAGVQVVHGVVLDIETSGSDSGGYVTRLMHDTPLNFGSAGSPLLNAHGQVIAIDVGNSANARIAGASRIALSASDIRSFLATTGQEFALLDDKRVAEVADIAMHGQAIANKSVFQIAIVGRAPRLSWTERIRSVHGIQAKAGWNALEDPWCTRCNGHGRERCGGTGCQRGQVTRRERYVDQRLPGTNRPVYKWRKIAEDCPVCKGDGLLTCQHCRGAKREPAL